MKEQRTSVSRDPVIDVMRGIAIWMVVGGHSWLPFGLFDSFVQYVQMVLFMALSGYVYRDFYAESASGIRTFVWKKIRTLYVPYVVVNGLFILLNNFFIKIGFFCTDIVLMNSFRPGIGADGFMQIGDMAKQVAECILFIGYSPRFGGATWFLRALFCVSVLYVLISHLFYKCKCSANWQVLVGVLFLLLWAADQNLNFIRIGTLDQVLLYYPAYAMGHYLKKNGQMEQKKGFILVGGILGIVLLQIGKAAVSLTGGTVLEIMSRFAGEIGIIIAGWLIIAAISIIIARYIAPVRCIFQWYGRGTLEVLLFHFLCFKLITVVCVWMEHLPFYYLAATPILPDVSVIWKFLYLVTGVTLPVIGHTATERFKKFGGMKRK